MSAFGAHFDENQNPSLTGVVGTQGTADTKGTAQVIPIGANPATGAMYVQDLSGLTLNTGTITTIIAGTQNTLGTVGTIPGVGIVTRIGNIGTIESGTITTTLALNTGTITTIVAGTQQTLGTVGVVNNIVTGTIASSGTTTGVGVVSNLTNGSINILTGTLQSSGTTTGVGVVSNLTNGSINILTGTLQSSGTTIGVGVVSVLTLGTVKINATPSGSTLLSAHTLGTAGAAFWGTLVAPVGAGTILYLAGLSVVCHTGTVDCGISNNVAGSTGAGVYARGFFPAGGGIARDFNPVIATPANGTLAYFLNGAGTASFTVNYWVSP